MTPQVRWGWEGTDENNEGYAKKTENGGCLGHVPGHCGHRYRAGRLGTSRECIGEPDSQRRLGPPRPPVTEYTCRGRVPIRLRQLRCVPDAQARRLRDGIGV